MKKTFGIIGAGNIAKAIAGHLTGAGYSVTLSSRKDPSSISEAAKADIVILAMPWSQLATITALTDWKDKIVIDATNHFITYAPDFQLADVGGKASSEVVAGYVPGARLVKAFNTLYFKLLETSPREVNGRRILFVSGDHAEANKEVGSIIDTLGFSAIDLGPLAIGGKLQQAKGPLASLDLIKKD